MNPDVRQIPTPYAIADAQIAESLAHTYQSTEEFPVAPWPAMQRAIGPLLPGMLVVVGARPNQGKTSLLASWFSDLFRNHIPTLYCISGDGGPARLRRILAAMHCGFLRRAVLRNEWHDAAPPLPAETAMQRVWADLKQQREWAETGMVYDVPNLDRPSLREALHFGIGRGARVVIVDHVNRWTPATNADLTRDLAEAIRDLAIVAAQKMVTVILAAQITPWAKDNRNVLSEFRCPPLSALKQSQALVEEPHVVLLLHRMQRLSATDEDVRLASIGQKEARDLIEPGILCATVGKNRDDDTVGMTVRLRIDRTGRITDDPFGPDPR